MKNNKSDNKYSNDHLFYEILVRIFTTLHVADLAKASMVCKAWNVASRAPELWKTLDLNKLGMNVPLIPYAWFGEHSSKKMTQILKYASSLSGGNISCLIFNYYVYLTDVHLISIAQRTPNLKRIVLPITGNISKFGVENAMRSWGGIESITITEMFNNINFFDAVGKYCKNIVRLKFTCSFEQDQAEAIVKYTPNLRKLSIRHVMVSMTGLCQVLNSLEHLEVVNLCHCLVTDLLDGSFRVYSIDDLRKRVNFSCKLIICLQSSCLRCTNRLRNDRRRLSFGILEDIWSEDEISSLAH